VDASSEDLTDEEKELYHNYLSTSAENQEEVKEEESASEPESTEELEEEIINNEDDLTEEDKSMIEGYLDKVDASSEDLTDEEKELYQNYLSTSAEETDEEEDYNNELKEEVSDEELEDLVYINNVQIDEIRDSDLNMLENIIKGNDEDGVELIRIDDKINENNNTQEDNTKAKSLENFDSMEELLNKETNMSEEKELETIEKENLDENVAVEEEFSLGDDNEPILMEDEKHAEDDEDDFDGEITQSDLDYAIKLFESEESNVNTNEYSSKQDILLSENEINKFKKLFGYFKNIVEKMSPEDLNDFSKTEFYDMYSSLFRKFGD
ncbi:hypothetical protein, partial [Brachyspira hyodysenteriae]